MGLTSAHAPTRQQGCSTKQQSCVQSPSGMQRCKAPLARVKPFGRVKQRSCEPLQTLNAPQAPYPLRSSFTRQLYCLHLHMHPAAPPSLQGRRLGRLGSSEQPPAWLRPHEGERIPHSFSAIATKAVKPSARRGSGGRSSARTTAANNEHPATPQRGSST